MRRADIAHVSTVPGGADYIFTLSDPEEGSACCGGHEFVPVAGRDSPPRPLRASVVTGSLAEAASKVIRFRQTSHGIAHCSPGGDSLGVHRYKPIPIRHFCRYTPIVEVPNRSVDMDSWDRSACYPRGTFYPLSDGPSTWDRRITRPCFRICSTCRSRS
jgi:hypothetical protein